MTTNETARATRPTNRVVSTARGAAGAHGLRPRSILRAIALVMMLTLVAVGSSGCHVFTTSSRMAALEAAIEREQAKDAPNEERIKAMKGELDDLRVDFDTYGDRRHVQTSGPLGEVMNEAGGVLASLVAGYFGIRYWRGAPGKRKGLELKSTTVSGSEGGMS